MTRTLCRPAHGRRSLPGMLKASEKVIWSHTGGCWRMRSAMEARVSARRRLAANHTTP